MKIRNGFVSNSSSSSFLVFGRTIFQHNLDIDKLENIYARGENQNEGENYFPLTKEIFKYMQLRGITNDFEFIKQYFSFDFENGDPTIKRKDLPEEFTVYGFMIAQSTIETVEDFKKYYWEEE
jgi:hypothetical protein